MNNFICRVIYYNSILIKVKANKKKINYDCFMNNLKTNSKENLQTIV